MKRLLITTKKQEIWVEVDDKYIITKSLSMVYNFEGQPLKNLTDNILKNTGGYNIQRMDI